MTFFVKKVEWEYGEKYGHVFYPKNPEDFQGKLQKLEMQGIERKWPFYIEVSFIDDSYLGLVIGHELSCFFFGVFVSETNTMENRKTLFDGHYDSSKEHEQTYIEYSFRGDHGEKRLAEMLPKKLAFDAMYRYIEKQKFPSYIQFTRLEFVDKYIEIDDI